MMSLTYCSITAYADGYCEMRAVNQDGKFSTLMILKKAMELTLVGLFLAAMCGAKLKVQMLQ